MFYFKVTQYKHVIYNSLKLVISVFCVVFNYFPYFFFFWCSRIQFVFILRDSKIQQSGMTIDITQRKSG